MVRSSRHRLGSQLRAPLDHLDLVGKLAGKLVDLVQDDEVDGLLHEVHDVVEAGREAVDVLAIERRDERRVDPAHDRVSGLVAVVLGLAHALWRWSCGRCRRGASRRAVLPRQRGSWPIRRTDRRTSVVGVRRKRTATPVERGWITAMLGGGRHDRATASSTALDLEKPALRRVAHPHGRRGSCRSDPGSADRRPQTSR